MKEGNSPVTADQLAQLEQWHQQVQDCQNSNQTIKAWCQSQDIPLATYYYRRRKVFAAYSEGLLEQDPHTTLLLPEDFEFAELVQPESYTPPRHRIVVHGLEEIDQALETAIYICSGDLEIVITKDAPTASIQAVLKETGLSC